MKNHAVAVYLLSHRSQKTLPAVDIERPSKEKKPAAKPHAAHAGLATATESTRSACANPDSAEPALQRTRSAGGSQRTITVGADQDGTAMGKAHAAYAGKGAATKMKTAAKPHATHAG